MKKIYVLLLTLFIASLSFGQSVFINEIHYDNSGADVNEGFEIAGPAGTDLAIDVYTVELYNGSNGTIYDTVALTGVIPDEMNGMGTSIWFTGFGSIQNGAPDGLALIKNGVLIQFLSYEGTFTAIEGGANGITSTDIGVSETGSTPIGNSLQLIGTGNDYSDFTWSSPVVGTPGVSNTGQVLPIKTNQIQNLSVYPNPVKNGYLTINSANTISKYVKIYDVLGKQVLSTTTQNNVRINVSNLNAGIYILRVEETGKLATSKLIIQ